MHLNRKKVKIIAEVHPQHHGDMDKLKRMVLQCKIGGADYVKVQVYNSEKLFNDDKPVRLLEDVIRNKLL